MKVKLKNVIFTTVFSVAILAACFAASCKKSGYTVSFDTGIVDTEVSSVTRSAYAALGELPQPENEDYTFCGWYFEEDWETEVWEDYAVTEDMTLYAKWIYCGAPKIATGCNFGLVIDSLGNLWSFGNNTSGQLGDGTTENSTTPIQIMAGTKFNFVAASTGNGAAIDTEGNLYVWGSNYHGQVGDGTLTNRLTPYHVMEGTKFKYVDCADSGSSTYAITEDGILYAWGRNTYGVLGIGTSTNVFFVPTVDDPGEDKLSPVRVHLDAKITTVSAVERGCIAVDEEGNIWTWGNNSHGEIGNGVINNVLIEYSTPQKLDIAAKFTNAVRVSLTAYAVDTDGNLWAWGYNYRGQLLDGTTEDNATPKMIEGYEAKYITDDGGGIAFIDSNNFLWVFGTNIVSNGERDSTGLYIPVQDFSDKRVYQVSMSFSNVLVISTSGELWIWGKNSHGQLCNGTVGADATQVFPATKISINVK